MQMRVFLQVWLCLFFAGVAVGEKAFEYDVPVVRVSLFGEELGMVNRERDEYATNLADYAANLIAAEDASVESLAMSRRIIALALHLAPRNRRAMVLNFQLGKGLKPQKVASQYSAQTLAQLFVTRAQVLFQQKGKSNILLSRCLVEMAATIDPRNEDAVYAFQLQEIDHGPVNWSRFTDSRKSQSSK